MWYEFKEILRKRLKQVYTDRQYQGDRVFNKIVQSNNLYPYSRYTVQWIPTGNQNRFIVNIETFDNASSCETLERFQSYFIDDLDRIIEENENLFFKCEKASIGDILEETEDLNRRLLILEFKVQRVS